MKLLILCDLFPPAFGPRMGYLCKYLRQNGWKPVVVTEQINDTTFAHLAHYAEVHRVNYFRAKGRWAAKLEWLTVFVLDLLCNYKSRKMAAVAKRLAQKGEFGGLLCSTYRTFPLPAAAKVARQQGLPFVADLRDIVEQYASNEYISRPLHTFPWLDNCITRLFRWHLLRHRNKALRVADCLTTVSPWHVETLQAFNPEVKLIYNGFDPELFYPQQIVTPQFRITYTGRLLSLATRDPQLLFEAVACLEAQGTISPAHFRMQWYVDAESRTLLIQEAERYKVTHFMDYFGYVAADAIPEVLNNSSILLQLANRTTEEGPKGFMTTKLFESFAVEKPLLCVRSDEACLEQTIRHTNAGLAARTTEEVISFLTHYYAQWQKQGYTTSNIDREAYAPFSRSRQAVQFMELFEQLKKRNNG